MVIEGRKITCDRCQVSEVEWFAPHARPSALPSNWVTLVDHVNGKKSAELHLCHACVPFVGAVSERKTEEEPPPLMRCHGCGSQLQPEAVYQQLSGNEELLAYRCPACLRRSPYRMPSVAWRVWNLMQVKLWLTGRG